MFHPTEIMTGAEGLEQLRELTKTVKFCMLATRTAAGDIRSRPMTLQQTEFEGDLWFFTSKSSALSDDIVHDSSVNISFARANRMEFISITGHGRFVDDPGKIRELWRPAYAEWFPTGIEDPDLALLQVEITYAEHWDEAKGQVNSIRGVAEESRA